MLTSLAPPHNAEPQQQAEFERMAASLTKVISNLAANKKNRDIMGEGTTIKDLLELLDMSGDENVIETTLRAIMNLAISPENEDRIRDEGGLPRFIAILKDKETPAKIALQNSRVLVNLSGNDMNRVIMLREGGAERVLELLFEPISDGYLYRVIRLLGAFSTGCEVSLYERLATRQVAQRLVELLRKAGSPSELLVEGNEEKKALAEVILLAVWKLSSERSAKHRAITEQFQSVFLESGLELICALLLTDDTAFIGGGLNAIHALGKGNSKVQAAVREHEVWAKVNSLTSAKVAAIKDKAVELVRDFSGNLESLD